MTPGPRRKWEFGHRRRRVCSLRATRFPERGNPRGGRPRGRTRRRPGRTRVLWRAARAARALAGGPSLGDDMPSVSLAVPGEIDGVAGRADVEVGAVPGEVGPACARAVVVPAQRVG